MVANNFYRFLRVKTTNFMLVMAFHSFILKMAFTTAAAANICRLKVSSVNNSQYFKFRPASLYNAFLFRKEVFWFVE